METTINDEEFCIFGNKEFENISDHLENWKEYEGVTTEDSLQGYFNLKTDPLLSQVQMDENSGLDMESFTTVYNQTTKNLKLKDKKRLSILRLINKNKKVKDMNMNTVDKKYKDRILVEQKAFAIEMIHIRNGVGLVIKDADLNQMFLTQHIKMLTVPTQSPICYQFVKCINFQEICNKTDIKLPQIVTSIGSKIHLCPVRDCTEAFLQRAQAKTHALKHLGIKPFNCNYPGCIWEFYNQNHLQRHFATHEPPKKNFICQFEGCNRYFTTVYNLNEHKKKCHEQPATKYCPVDGCTSVFRTEKELRIHCKGHKDCEAPFKCDTECCNRRFFTQSDLIVHSRVHQFANRNVCHFPDCGKNFNTGYRLKEHIRSHTGSRPYACKYDGCKWMFTTASKLRRHEMTHSNEKKFHCTIKGCNKAFRRSEHLKDHTLTHLDHGKCHHCDICGMSYSGKPNHMKKYHADILKDQGVKLSKRNDKDRNVYCNLEDDCVLEENAISCDKSDEQLLEEAIKSLGVPEITLEDELLSDTLHMENGDFSTVNLKDLD